jgi:hypothetical protein|tara:strand:- start:184 stop:408 length:225 start_codon:yes stop_codon:yes gene_type:complete
MTKLKVENNHSLERDTINSAIINTNMDAYTARLEQIRAWNIKQLMTEQQTKDIDNLKNDVTEIKKMLRQLIGGQ